MAVDGAHSVRGEGRGTPLHPGGAVSSQLLGAVRSTGRARLQRPLTERRVRPSQETFRLRLFLEGNSAGSCRGAGARSERAPREELRLRRSRETSSGQAARPGVFLTSRNAGWEEGKKRKKAQRPQAHSAMAAHAWALPQGGRHCRSGGRWLQHDAHPSRPHGKRWCRAGCHPLRAGGLGSSQPNLFARGVTTLRMLCRHGRSGSREASVASGTCTKRLG
eukprot:COSAG01_NODE_3155_length_6492_cov_3.966995_3_plen_220_part_00